MIPVRNSMDEIWPCQRPERLSPGTLSWVEIKPASNGRNDPASGARIRPHEKRGIILSNKARHQRVNAGFVWKKMSTYADFRGWVISAIAGWFVVTAEAFPV